MINQRLETMRVASSNLKQGDVALVELVIVRPDEIGDEHTFRWPLHQNGRVGEEQIRVLGPKISGHETLRLTARTKNLRQIDNSGDRHFRGHTRRQPPEVAQARERRLMRDMARMGADNQLGAQLLVVTKVSCARSTA